MEKQNKKPEEYKLTYTREEMTQRIHDIETTENFQLAMKIRDGIRLDEERMKLIQMLQGD